MVRKHFIEFRQDAKLTSDDGKKVCRFNMGQMTTAQVHCYVVYANDHYLEVADIEVKEGIMCGVPCYCFMFIDEMD